MEQREQKPTDGAARGEAKLAWAIPSRDRGRQSQTCLDYAEISCKREQSQACLAMPSAADIQRKLIAKEEDEVKTKAKPTDMVISHSTCMLILLVA